MYTFVGKYVILILFIDLVVRVEKLGTRFYVFMWCVYKLLSYIIYSTWYPCTISLNIITCVVLPQRCCLCIIFVLIIQ
jgi:hypothetical protein